MKSSRKRKGGVAETVEERLIRIARELINRKGDFDLSMRDLATRAKVSLRTPYQVFGSKTAIITEILHRDQEQAGFRLTGHADADLSEVLFSQLTRGIEFMGARQPFYRALFRASQGYSGDKSDVDTARGIQKDFALWCERAHDKRLLQRHVSPELAAEVLTNVFAAELRHWANDDFDIRLAGLRINFGVAAVLAGLGATTFGTAMRAKAADFQALILEHEGFRPSSGTSGVNQGHS